MDTEIELKYLVLGDNTPAVITDLLNQQNISFVCQTKQLINCYFDTPDLQLRKADIGLRIRHSSIGASEQTIKTAGKVIAGLHQRPEYNVPITGDIPNLDLFAVDIWPEHFDVDQVSTQLAPLFETNFCRTTWLLTSNDGSEIELAFDLGEVKTQAKSEPICEVELELVSGDRASLFDLAKLLFKHLALRPGILSKAARGYGLVFGRVESHISAANTTLELNLNMSLMTSFQQGFSECIEQSQHLINQFIDKPELQLLKEISDSLALTRHGLWLYKDYISADLLMPIRAQIKVMLKQLSWVETAKQIRELTTKTGNYRKKIEYSQSLLNELKDEKHAIVDYQSAIDLFHSEAFNVLQLAMLELVVNDLPEPKQNTTLTDLAPSWLSIGWDDITNVLASDKALNAGEYLQHHALLTRSLLTGCWFGQLFDGEGRMEFRGPWLDLHLGIEELATLMLLKNHLQSTQQDLPSKLINWLDNKIDNLLCALEHSKQAALKLPPYWLK
ncbi:inorganic triphosphatase [Colwelliaceae bacterium BS250]